MALFFSRCVSGGFPAESRGSAWRIRWKQEVVVSAATRWVTFDCFGTLVNWQAGFVAALTPLVGDRASAIVQAYPSCQREVEQQRPHRSYKQVLTEAITRAAATQGVELSTADADAIARSWGSLPLFDDVEAMLAGLRRDGWRLAVLTNCDDDLFEATHRSFRTPFDLFVTAERVRGYKPAPWHFRAFELITRTRRANWVHVASGWYHDIAPARSVGIQRVWLDRDHTTDDPTRASALVHAGGDVPAAIDSLFVGQC
jgi:2-haloacid dehalogenase